MSNTDALEDLRKIVGAISKGVKEMRSSGISDAALVALIQEACPYITVRSQLKKPGKEMIRTVLVGMDGLEEYVFPSNDKE